MPGKMSRNKGKRGELEAAKKLSEVLGIPFRRSCQYQATPDSPDLVGTGLDDLYLEVKYRQKMNLLSILEETVQHAVAKLPVVVARSNRTPWVIVLQLDDLPRLVQVIAPLLKEPNNDQKTT